MDIFIPAEVVNAVMKYLLCATFAYAIYETIIGTPFNYQKELTISMLPAIQQLDASPTLQDQFGRLIMYYIWNGVKMVILPINILFYISSLCSLIIAWYYMHVYPFTFLYSVLYLIWLGFTRFYFCFSHILNKVIKMPMFKTLDLTISIFYFGYLIYCIIMGLI